MTAADASARQDAARSRRGGGWAVNVIAVILAVAAMKLARGLLLPIAIALLLTLLLGSVVRWLRAHRIPDRVGAALVVFGALGLAIGSAALLVVPAVEWVTTAPATLERVEKRVRLIAKPIAALQQSAERMERVAAPAPDGKVSQVQVSSPSILARVSAQTMESVPAILSVIFLTYFLLASGPLFRRKLSEVLPGRRDVKQAEHLLSEIEVSTSRVLSTTTVINAGVGVVTAVSLTFVGLPNAIVAGALAAVLNFVPYVGAIVTATIIALTALASIDDTGRAILAPATFIAIHLVEANFVTPTLLGRRLPLSTVTVFLGLIFFSWVWGPLGAVLAVPLTVVVKITCDHVPSLRQFGMLLDS